MPRVSRATLYVIPGSHPAASARGMLEAKGIPYKRVDLLPVISRGALKLMRFPEVTIPALRIDGQRVSGSRNIARVLDRVQPEPPLFPGDPERRVLVEDAERWGDEILQGGVRRILWNAIKRDKRPLASFAEGARLGIPVSVALATAAPIIAAEVRINGADDPAVRADLAAFGDWLDRIDGWIGDGLLGADAPNAADFQLAGSLRLAMTLDDLRPEIERRPAGELATRLIPHFPGRVPPVLPAEWLEPLRR
jgi:glutathione S-transferase